MSTSDGVLQFDAEQGGASKPRALSAQWRELLQRGFAAEFTVLDGLTGEVLEAPQGQPSRDWGLREAICQEVARRGRPELIDDEDPFLTLAIPLPQDAFGTLATALDEEPVPTRATPLGAARSSSPVAVGTFVSRPVRPDENLARSAELLGMEVFDAGHSSGPTRFRNDGKSFGPRTFSEAAAWASRQPVWSAKALNRVADLVLAQAESARRIRELEQEAQSLSVHLAGTYEEISLLYRLTQNLKISQSDEALGRIALEWMKEVVPAAGLAIQLVPVAEGDQSLNHQVRTEPVLLTYGDCPIDNQQFTALIQHLGPSAINRPTVANRQITGRDDWPVAQIRQVIAVSLAEGENVFGWLAALNHTEDDEFGTVEASLLSSVAAILGIHSGNIELYRQQSELMAGIIRALTSAIDAKDPYTCGHSDRVARVAVRLAEELGCDAKTLNTIYLSGLLHDIGKIGINDSVLRKPGKLSEEEYEHIKQHVEIGHKILRDLGKLDEVLPVILHHHESWDGGGYPHKLGSERIPLPARIVAVADAYDAMGSDRPYRKGMPDEKIDEIFQAGSGQQWDPDVVAALFRARDDIRRITREPQQGAEVALPQQLT